MREITITASKSDAHRAWICAMLSDRPCKITGEGTSDDIEATKACMEALREAQRTGEPAQLKCGESGSTLRFLLPVAAALGVRGEFFPEGRLGRRPLSPLYEALIEHGCTLSSQGSVPLTIEGRLTPGLFLIPGNVSSQYISGLMFALPLLDGDSVIAIPGHLQSAGYVKMTLRTLRRFGIQITIRGGRIDIPGNQQYQPPEEYRIEGDWSNAAFWMTMGALGEEEIRVKGLETDTAQGDAAILELLDAFGADVKAEGHSVLVRPSRGKLKAIEIDAGNIPDLVPELAVLAAFAKGTTIISNAQRLRLKESDRLDSTAALIGSIGGTVEERPDGLTVTGSAGELLRGGQVDGFRDHRIVMAAAAASLGCRDKVTITGSDAVSKSYPGFFREMENADLAGNVVRE